MRETPLRDRGDDRATGQPSRGTRTWGVLVRYVAKFACPDRPKLAEGSLSKEHPRTPGRMAISAVAAG